MFNCDVKTLESHGTWKLQCWMKWFMSPVWLPCHLTPVLSQKRTCMYWQFIEIKNNYSTLHKRAYLFQKCNLVDAYRLKVSFINKKKITNSRTSQLPWKGTCTWNSKTSRWHHKCKNGTVGKAQLFHIGDLLSTFGNSGPEGVAFGEAQKCESKIL